MDKIKLIFNADDFGLTKGVNLGIIETYQNGPVRSTTIMAGADEFEHGVRLAKENPGLGVGIHLTLTAIHSVGGAYKTLTDEKGKLLPLVEFEQRQRAGMIDFEEVEAELEAQIQKALNAGIHPSHFDSHHHVHQLPGMLFIVHRLAKKYGVNKIRLSNPRLLKGPFADLQTTARFEDGFFEEGVSMENLKRLIRNFKGNAKGNVMEIMVHPAYGDSVLPEISSYVQRRRMEKDILTSKELRHFLEHGNVEVVSFSDL